MMTRAERPAADARIALPAQWMPVASWSREACADDPIPLEPCARDCRKPCAHSRRGLHALLISIGLAGCPEDRARD